MSIAAAIVGIALAVNLFTTDKQEVLVEQNTLSDAEMEEYYQYYEDQVTENSYHEAVFLEVDL
jgi:hypothetical protein